MMNRLTNASVDSRNSNAVRLFCEVEEALKKLKEYEDLEQQGNLVKLPLRIGQTVYFIDDETIEECTVETIYLGKYIDEDENDTNMAEIKFTRKDCSWSATEIHFSDIGKFVFFDKENAEKHLASKIEIPICFCGEKTEAIVKDIKLSYKDKVYEINNASIDRCSKCGESFIKEKTWDKVKNAIGEDFEAGDYSKIGEDIFNLFEDQIGDEH